MTTDEILRRLLREEPRVIVPTMQLGGSNPRLHKLADAGTISRCWRGISHRKPQWYLTEEQAEALRAAIKGEIHND